MSSTATMSAQDAGDRLGDGVVGAVAVAVDQHAERVQVNQATLRPASTAC
jgi:hypothetical protein